MGLWNWLFGSDTPPPEPKEEWENDIKVNAEVTKNYIHHQCQIPSYCVPFFTSKLSHCYLYNSRKISFSFMEDGVHCDVQVGEYYFDRYNCLNTCTHECRINLRTSASTWKKSTHFGSHLTADNVTDFLIAKIKNDYNNISLDFINLSPSRKRTYVLKSDFLAPRYFTEKEIRSMSWRAFEKFIEQLFVYNDFRTQLTPPANDEGKDIIACKNDDIFFVECKHWSADCVIGREYLQKLVGAAISHSVYNVVFVATCAYNENAISYANLLNIKSPMNIELWTLDDILNISVR